MMVCAGGIGLGLCWHFHSKNKVPKIDLFKRKINHYHASIDRQIHIIQSALEQDNSIDYNIIKIINSVLDEMATIDQEVRLSPDLEAQYKTELDKIWFEIDNRNIERLLKILAITKREWFSISEFGKTCNRDAWLIIQHADLDIQVKFLTIIEKFAKKGESYLQDWATLYDRVALAQDKPQRFGTQVHKDTFGFEDAPVEDLPNLEKRRKEVGLPPMDEYIIALESMYGKKKPVKTSHN